MRILVACEESQVVTLAFREFGHDAFSCDLKPCSGGYPEFHIQRSCLDILDDGWDMMIGHPPCTFLAKSGACNNQRDPSRIEKGYSAARFFYALWNCDIPRICLENPVPQKRFGLPPYSQTIQPYDFGDWYSKLTLLWEKNLPPLIPTVIGYPDASWCAVHRDATIRSKTFPGVARAMAQQWSFL